VDRIADRAEELEVSRDVIVSTLIQSGLDAMDEGHLTLITTKTVETAHDVRGRPYDKVIVQTTWEWSCKC
jgi:hypothetical protein